MLTQSKYRDGVGGNDARRTGVAANLSVCCWITLHFSTWLCMVSKWPECLPVGINYQLSVVVTAVKTNV